MMYTMIIFFYVSTSSKASTKPYSGQLPNNLTQIFPGYFIVVRAIFAATLGVFAI